MPRKPRHWRKDFPYYKVQLFNRTFVSWTDGQDAFSSIEEAREYIKRGKTEANARIVAVERDRRYVLG